MISIAIQAGGESRRMGRNKALVPFGGQALIAHVAARLAGLGDELFVTAKQPDLYAFLGLPVYPDVVPGQGALGGLLTAAKLEVVEPLCAAAQTAGFAPRLVVPGWQATLAGFRLARPAEPAGALVLRVGTRSASFRAASRRSVSARSAVWRLSRWLVPR